jgi:FtsP/CotA-like multicopper oxidase with cupredoxin domain
MEFKEFKQQVYPASAGFKPATLLGYDGMSPGPTFIHNRGQEAVVRLANNSPKDASCHLHGSYSRAPWDGWAEDLTAKGEFKDYYWPNGQSARMLWYHDHAIDHTAENAYFGLAGAYLINDLEENERLPTLPRGYREYDFPLVLASKQYNKDGTLFSPAGETDSLFGDVIQVNGIPWPKLDVQTQMYRFRFLNAAISRSFLLYFEDESGKKLDFQVIGSDSGLLEIPVTVNQLYISMAERYEVIFDFNKHVGKKVTLRNTRDFAADKDYKHTDKVMQFVVSKTKTDPLFSVPSSLREIPRSFPRLRPTTPSNLSAIAASGPSTASPLRMSRTAS